MRGTLLDGVFFLHEDEWGMIDIMPIENLKGSHESAREAQEFGEAHFDGFGWTDMYLIPEPAHPLSARKIPLAHLRELVVAHLSEAETVQSGIMPGEVTPREDATTGFAFGGEDEGAMYGDQENGTIHYLHILPPSKSDPDILAFWASALSALGSTYQLMLTDWWSKVTVDLSDRAAVERYLRGERP